MRKLIQIEVASWGLYGLCDDGSVWLLRSGPNEEWLQAAALPGGEV